MNSNKTERSEPVTGNSPAPPNQLALSIQAPEMLSLLPTPTPPNNYVGTLLLSEAIRSTLAGAGILIDDVSCGGQLNDSNFMVKVTDRGTAFHLLQGLLKKAGLFGHSAAGYLSPDWVWIMAWPVDYPPEKFKARQSPEWVSAEQRRHLAWLEQSRANTEEIINQLIPLADSTQRAALELARQAWDSFIAQLKSESGEAPQP